MLAVSPFFSLIFVRSSSALSTAARNACMLSRSKLLYLKVTMATCRNMKSMNMRHASRFLFHFFWSFSDSFVMSVGSTPAPPLAWLLPPPSDSAPSPPSESAILPLKQRAPAVSYDRTSPLRSPSTKLTRLAKCPCWRN